MTAGNFTIGPQGEREIVIRRSLKAPRQDVFKALTTPSLLRRWLGPKTNPMVECQAEPKVGGKYRFVWRGQDGNKMACGGTVREFTAPERFSVTERFDEPWYPGEAIITYALAEQGKGTALTLTLHYESKEGRDGVLKTPMQQGLRASYDQLEEMLASGNA